MKSPSKSLVKHDVKNLDPAEIIKFQDLAAQWWDTDGGPMAPLHRMTPCRLEFITTALRGHFGQIKGLTILDVGCGGGIAAEALTRLGARVAGIDGAADLIDIARQHAAEQNLKIDYHTALTADLVQQKKQFDAVIALEVIEHVPDQNMFVSEIARLTKKNGLTIFSTLNRTAKSFAFGIVAAEYVLRWLPTGTHNWKTFVKPSELHQMCATNDLEPVSTSGMVYQPLTRDFALDARNLDINYLLSAVKHG